MTTTTEPLFTTWITAWGDCYAHAVTDEAVADARATGDGVYQAICGYRLFPLPLLCPPGAPCLGCSGVLRACSVPREVERHRHRKSNWFVRLLARVTR